MKERKSNFELLRIVCILMIITLHYCNGDIGGALANTVNKVSNYYIINIMESLCIVAVNVFILITGYFSYDKKSIKISKIFKLIFLCVFYGIMIYIILLLTNKVNVDKDSLLLLLKTIFDRWFIVIYIILYLLIPYINKLIDNISKKDLWNLILINYVFFYLWTTIFTKTPLRDNGYGIVNFITLYLIGAYISKYNKKDISKIKTFLMYVICSLLTFAYVKVTSNSYAYNNIFVLIASVSLFLTFKNMNINYNKVINYLATFTIPIYVIHENLFISKILYRDIFKCDHFYKSNYILINMIYTVIGIYLICIIVEIVRRLIMKKIVDEKIEKIKYELKV